MKKFQKLLSFTLILFLLISATAPAVSAEPSYVYYELHNLCICEESEDLGKIPYVTWGIGYKAWIDKQTDNWEIFIHAGKATKKFTITPETDLGGLVTLRDFVNNVNECREEIDQIHANIVIALTSGTLGIAALAKGVVKDDAIITASGVAAIGCTVSEFQQASNHFNKAKTAQENAETLFGALNV